MGDTWGRRIRLSIFGESHGPAVGIMIDGLPAGEIIDLDAVSTEMARRAPGQSGLSTPRRETDEVEIVSGLYNGKTTGNAVCGMIRNQNARSQDYEPVLRPGHADWTALMKYGGHADMRGGGHFSGRLTAPLVFAGAIAKQVLGRRGITVCGRITAIAGIRDESVPADAQACRNIAQKAFPAADEATAKQMQDAILRAKEQQDSVGGVIEVHAFGVPAGWGDPFFDSLESTASSLFFSIPAVKGVEFGDGFALAGMQGSEANDPLFHQNDKIYSDTNHNGGILGGISNGMPVTARLAVKPTPSIGKPQQGIDTRTMKETTIKTHGRHDPCIVPRAVPVAEAALALALLDCMTETIRRD